MLYPHPEPLSLRQTTANLSLHRRRSNTVLWVLVCTRFLFFYFLFFLFFSFCTTFLWGLWASLAGMGFDLNTNSPLLPSCWGFSFAFGHGVSPHSRSSAHCFTGVSLTLDMGYVHRASPVKRRRHSWPWTWGISSLPLLLTLLLNFRLVEENET